MAFVVGGAGASGGRVLVQGRKLGVRPAVVPTTARSRRCALRMTATEEAERVKASETEGAAEIASDSDWKVKLLYDGECPICMKEVVFLMKKDAGRGLIKFVDIASEDYKPEENANVSWSRAMGRIHAILPDSSIVTGVKVFQKTYEVIGLGWLFSATKLPVVGNIADGMYDIWAKYRLKITGRSDLEEIIREKEARALEMEEDGECEDTCRAEYDEDEELEALDLGLDNSEKKQNRL